MNTDDIEADLLKHLWVLDWDHTARRPVSLEEGALFKADHSKSVVQKTEVGEIEVSTVFLGIDHSFMSNKLVIFETALFGSKLLHGVRIMRRYSNWVEALAGHWEIVQELKESQG